MNKLGRITITFLLALTGLGVQAKIITYPVPTGIYYARHNDDYNEIGRASCRERV